MLTVVFTQDPALLRLLWDPSTRPKPLDPSPNELLLWTVRLLLLQVKKPSLLFQPHQDHRPGIDSSFKQVQALWPVLEGADTHTQTCWLCCTSFSFF